MNRPRPLPRVEDPHDAEQAAQRLGVPAARIRAWHRAGKIAAHGYVSASVPGGRQPLFTLDEIRPLAERYHAEARGIS